MPRRRPAAIRLDKRVLTLRGDRHERIDGLSTQAMVIVDRLEVTRRWPGSTAAGIRNYRRWIKDPRHRLSDNYGCGVPECCPDPADLREWLEIVVHHLPRRDRRMLQALLDEIDALW